jgi:hypothetical protein
MINRRFFIISICRIGNGIFFCITAVILMLFPDTRESSGRRFIGWTLNRNRVITISGNRGRNRDFRFSAWSGKVRTTVSVF